MALEARAHARWIRVAPRKMRLVADMVRGTGVQDAVNRLHFTPKRAALPIEKTVRSALANLLQQQAAAIRRKQRRRLRNTCSADGVHYVM